jgi:MFS family permease
VFELLCWRAIVGVGLGGEWAAGSVLVAETWPAKHRGKAIGLMQSGWAIGYIAAAVLAAIVLPRWGWRVLFVLGVIPALFTVWVRRNIAEPEVWTRRPSTSAGLGVLLRPPLRRLVILSATLCSIVLFAYWGLFTWIPAYLATPIERGGAGLGIVRSSAWIVPMQIGAFFGYTLFGFFADRVGRRPAFITFVLATAVLVPLYGLGARNPAMLMALGPLVGFFGHGFFSVFGVMLAELFPSGVRATAQGFCYNVGRAISALSPITVGALADRHGIGAALGITSIFFALGAAMMMLLPETKGDELA